MRGFLDNTNSAFKMPEVGGVQREGWINAYRSFLMQAGKVLAITACIIVEIALLYAEIIDPGQCAPN